MRILQVCSAATYGGGEVHVIELAAKLGERGHSVAIAGRAAGPLQPDYALPFLNAADFYSAWRLRRIVREGGFEVVHAHLARDYPVAAAALWGVRGPKLVLTRQLIYPVRPNPLYRRVDGWIATTPQILAAIQPLGPRSAAIVPNWVDSARMPYADRPWGDPVVIGLLGQVSPHKGHDDAIAMMRELGPGYRLEIGGVGRDDYVAALRERARGLPVAFHGFVRPEAFLSGVNVLILPSWEEPFGIVLLEAMACGVNVVATEAGGPPDILEHGRAGLVVPPRDPAAMARAIRRLAGDAALRERLRRRARERVLARYDIGRVVPEVEAFYMR